MIRFAVAVVAIAACGGDDGSGFPVMPGGGGSGSAALPDAAIDDGDASSLITGRVCVVADARQPTTNCAIGGADGLTVTLGSATATTASDGAFTIARPAGTGLVWTVTGAVIEPSAMPLAAGATIPAIATDVYSDMLVATNATIAGGDGAVIARLTRGGAAAASVAVAVSPTPVSSIYYDGTSAVDWGLEATGGFGMVWIPSVAPGSASISYDTGSTAGTLGAVPVYADTVTFVTYELP